MSGRRAGGPAPGDPPGLAGTDLDDVHRVGWHLDLLVERRAQVALGALFHDRELDAAVRSRVAVPVVAQQRIGARMPTAGERRHLEMKASQPLMTMTCMAFDAAGQAFEFGDHCYRAADHSIDLMVDER